MEWLHPGALWLAATLGIPLWLHLRHRSKPKEIAFPSLLLLRQGFPQAMQKQRLRDLLQLIIRLLLLACLVLALAQPVRRQSGLWPRSGVMLIDNGAYATLPSTEGGNALQAQLQESRHLEAQWSEGFQRIPWLIEPGPANSESRWGDVENAASRALATTRDHRHGDILLLPVYRWDRLAPALPLLGNWLKENPDRRLVLWDLTSQTKPLPHWTKVEIRPDSNGQSTLFASAVSANFAASSKMGAHVQFESGLVKPLSAKDQTFSLVLMETEKLAGKISLDAKAEAQGPWSIWHFAMHRNESSRVLHLGSTWSSLPSLSRPENRSLVNHLSEGQSLPSLVENEGQAYAAVMIAGMTPASDDLERLAAFVLEGGGLIVSMGPGTDAVALNSRLLAPLSAGRLTSWLPKDSGQTVRVHEDAFARQQWDPSRWGQPGKVVRAWGLEPDSSCSILLSAGQKPLLLHKRFGRGSLLLWLTSLDSLTWSDLGLSPFLPLMHQAFFQSLIGADKVIAVASDSVAALPSRDGEIVVLNPVGKPFRRWQQGLEGLRIGPFPQVGLYTVIQGRDTTTLQVNLNSPQEDIGGPNPTEQAWSLSLPAELQNLGKQILVTNKAFSKMNFRGAKSTWPFWLGAAVMLLLLDGLVALILNPNSPSPSNPWASKARQG